MRTVAHGNVALQQRAADAVTMHENGQPYRAIAKALGCSPERARQVVLAELTRRERAKAASTIQDLSARSRNGLIRMGFAPTATKEDVAPRLNEIRLAARDLPNFCRYSLREIRAWVGTSTPWHRNQLILRAAAIRADVTRFLTDLDAWNRAAPDGEALDIDDVSRLKRIADRVGSMLANEERRRA
jgi:hypothetical protein